ncbi:BRO1-domain-containing protein [Hortaea werneckii]|nr:BRO1-domain-containing protein [Hortaea werneckii]
MQSTNPTTSGNTIANDATTDQDGRRTTYGSNRLFSIFQQPSSSPPSSHAPELPSTLATSAETSWTTLTMASGGNILAIPFRRTHSLRLSDAIKSYISSKYDQHPATFQHDLEIIDQLRKDAVASLEAHSSGVRKLQGYAAQLVWMGGKFPVDIGADFTWFPSLGYHSHHPQTENNLRFELANIVFNLAAMYSQLALSSNRATADGLKTAASNFCLAAGVIQHLKTSILPELRNAAPPEDMDTLTLESLECLMLAQAQECFWQKAVKDGLKDASIAKLATKVSDLYSEAGDWAVKSASITSEWIHHINAKHHHFAAAAQYRAACDCLEKRKYGEEVARLRDALNCVNVALKEPKVNRAVTSDLQGLKNRVQEDLKRAEKDNDTIYLIPEPPKSELRVLDRASMVASRIPPELAKSQEILSDPRGDLGKPLFAKLVPYAVHVAASIYADRRDRLVSNTLVAEYEAMTQRIHELLSSLSLPGSLQALEKPLGLPPGLAGHAEEVRQANGVQRLHATIGDTEKLKASTRVLYQEGLDLLRTEAGEDEASRRKYGTDRWNRTPAKDGMPKLYKQVEDIQGYLQQADNSDQMVQERLRQNETLIRLLGGTNRDLEDFVPSSRRATMTAKVEREANQLRGCLNEVSRLEARRKRKVEQLRTKAKEDDVSSDLLREAGRLEREYPMQPVSAGQFEALFDERLNRYQVDEEELKNEEAEQEKLLTRIREANSSFQAVKKGDTSSREREQALQDLKNAHMTYKQVMRDLETGRKFYNDLAAIVTRFRDECRNFVYTRRSEAQVLEADLSTSMEGMRIQEQTQNQLLAEKEAQASQQRQARGFNGGNGSRSSSNAPSGATRSPTTTASESTTTPMAAPMPQRPAQVQQPPAVVGMQTPQIPQQTTWQEGMPIVFGGQQGSAAAAGAGGGERQHVNGAGGGAEQQTWDPSKGLKFMPR